MFHIPSDGWGQPLVTFDLEPSCPLFSKSLRPRYDDTSYIVGLNLTLERDGNAFSPKHSTKSLTCIRTSYCLANVSGWPNNCFISPIADIYLHNIGTTVLSSPRAIIWNKFSIARMFSLLSYLGIYSYLSWTVLSAKSAGQLKNNWYANTVVPVLCQVY